MRQPNAGFDCGHFQIDGPHRLVSTAGTRRWLLAPEYMYPIERATKSGLVGPWRTPDIGELPVAGLNPGGIEPWGISNFQIFPNIEILIYGGWYLLYRYWPTSHNTHRFEAYTFFHPAGSVRERIEHEVAAVVLKEFALQDAGMLGGTQAALEYGIVDRLSAQRPGDPGAPPAQGRRRLGRGLPARNRSGGSVTMAEVLLPSAFAELEHYAETWCLATETERWNARVGATMPELHEFYDAFFPRLEEAIDYCDKFRLDNLPDDALNLLHLIYSLIMVAMAVEILHQPEPVDAADAVMTASANQCPDRGAHRATSTIRKERP